MRRSLLWLGVPLVPALILLGGAGCDSVSCEDTETCGAPYDGGIDGGDGDHPDTPPGCDKSVDPKDSPACVASSVGIFVSPSGTDSDSDADGTKEKPYRTIGKAIQSAGEKARVYVCEGDYPEAIHIASPVAIYGGWSCADWTYSGNKPSVTSKAGEIAVTIDGATGTLIEDMAFTAAAATAKGGSSIAGLVANAQNVMLRRSSFTAQAAQPGEDGPADGGAYSPAQAQKGNDANGVFGGAESDGGACANGSGMTVGGVGAPAAGGGLAGGSGSANPIISPPFPDATKDGKGGTGTSCGSGATGHDGSYGPSGDGGLSAPNFGQLTSTGWTPTGGTPGVIGKVGQGGGGGASTDGTGGGGGGAAGGCGGSAGAPGRGGGSSLGLALTSAATSLDGVALTSSAAGNGGSGGPGQVAQKGGNGGVQVSPACAGGSGGHGGSGGGGGGGTGGLSVGILWTGTPPTINGNVVSSAASLDGITVAASAAPGGNGGPGGAAVVSGANAGGTGANGRPGVAQAVLELTN